MSSTDSLKLIQEKRRELQYMIMKQWSAGKMTGRDCLEQIISLEKIIFLDEKTIKRIREEYEKST